MDELMYIEKILDPQSLIWWLTINGQHSTCLFKHYNKQVAKQCCFASMWGLARLNEYGYKGSFLYGSYKEDFIQHAWIELDGLYYDLTLIQFETSVSPLFITKPIETYIIKHRYDFGSYPVTLNIHEQSEWLCQQFEKYIIKS